MMDSDIVSLANSFIQDNRELELKMTPSDITLISGWIQVQLLRERQCWKEKLDNAMTEIERQRKTALTWESKYESAGKPPQQNEVAEANNNLALLVQSQKKRIDQVEKRLSVLSNDRKVCLELLKIDNSPRDIAVSQTLRQTLRSNEKELKKMELNFQKELSAKEKEIETLHGEIDLLKQEISDLQRKCNESASRDENSMRVLCYTTTNKLFQNSSKTVSVPKDTDLPSQRVVDDIYNEKLRLTAENKRLRDVLMSTEDELASKDSVLRKYEKQIKSLKHDTTYRRNEIARKTGKLGKKNDIGTATEDKVRRQHAGPLTLTKFKNKYSSLPSLPLSRSAEGPVDGTSRSTPVIQTAKTAVHRCLRCNRLYRLMDNNKFSCHFHKKGKLREETMSSNGQVLGITYRWECCNRPSSSVGCCQSQHV